MSRSDELQRRRLRPDAPVGPEAGPPDDPRPASKTQRKAEMHSLQDLGEELVALEPARLAELAAEAALPDRLVEAVIEARKITAWGGRKRQLQFVGKLMRGIDAEPVRRRLAAWAHGQAMDAARQHALERWRDRLLAEPDALDALVASHPTLDRPRFRALIAKAQDERARAAPPHAYRELFRALKALDNDEA
jgi:ribosome-associated protein